MSFDLIIKNGLVATAADVGKYDIGVKDGKIAILAPSLDPAQSPGAKVIDAQGGFVTVGFHFGGFLTRLARGSGLSCSYRRKSFYGCGLCG